MNNPGWPDGERGATKDCKGPSPMSTSNETDYSEHLPTGLAGRLVAGLVLVVFLGSLFGTGIADVFFPVQGVQLIGEEAQEQERTASRARLRDGSLARSYEDKLRHHSQVRDFLLPRYAYYKFFYFDQAPDGITVGKEHWMFRLERIRLSPQSDSVLASCAVNSIVALDRRLLGNGVQLCVLPVPRKAWVAQRFLPRGVDGRHAVDDLLIEGLLEHVVSTVDLREAHAAAEPAEVYFKLDTHWTPRAARQAAREFARSAGILKEESQRKGTLRTLPPDFRFSNGFAILRSLGVDLATIDLERLGLRMPEFQRLSFGAGLERWMRQPKPLSPLALAGTSFSKNERVARFLVHFSGERVLDGTLAARPYGTSVKKTLVMYAPYQSEGLLKRLFWELPISSIFHAFTPAGPGFGEAFSRCFQVFPAQEHQSWQPPARSWRNVGGDDLVTLGRATRTVLNLPGGALAHSGDGVALLHIVGEVQDAPLLVSVVHDGMSVKVSLQPGDFDITLPILAPGPSSAALRVDVHSTQEARFKLVSASLQHQPVGSGRFKLSQLELEDRTELVPLAPIFLGRRAALLMQCLAGRGALQDVVLELWLEGQDEPRRIRFAELNAGAAVLLDLGHSAGHRLSRVVLRAERAAPRVHLASVSSGA
jgi:hypothetical protein